MFLCVAHARAQDCHVWSRVGVDSRPGARSSHTMIYDSERRRVVLVGGQWPSAIPGDTWEWDGFAWTQVSQTGPRDRIFAAGAYDRARHLGVLFGGWGPPLLGDTWEWGGTAWAFRTESGPPPRYAHSMAYDSVRGVAVLFGGWVEGGTDCFPCLDDDTWEWDGNRWRNVGTTGPSARYLHAMAFDETRGVTVLAGGYDGGHPGDLWEWNGRTWVRRDADGPTPRRMHALAYDTATRMTVMFGGIDAGENALNDTWGWDGDRWVQLATEGPEPRYHHAMVYDDARGALVLFGGTVEGNSFGDTWRFADCVDHDEDGVLDHLDRCLDSNVESTIAVDGCQTDVANKLFDDGCTMADRITECAAAAGNHGDFVSCVAQLTHDLTDQGVLTPRDKGPIQRCAAQASLPASHVEERKTPKSQSPSPLEPLRRR